MRSLIALFGFIVIASAAPAAGQPGASCEKRAAAALKSCVASVAKLSRRCYLATGSPCADTDPAVQRALDRIDKKVASACPDASTVVAAGYGPLMTPGSVVARLREACAGNTASLAARAFGGPHAAALRAAATGDRACLENAQKQGASLMRKSFQLRSKCIGARRRGGTCDAVKTEDKIARRITKTAARIAARCTTAPLENLVAVDALDFSSRADMQGRCMVAVAHGDATPFSLGCGPRPEVPVPPRGQDVQIVLDEAVWGTRCGLGDPYAFWIRLAPQGSPVERIAFHLQGGGACFTEAECQAAPANRFDALGDPMPHAGWFKTAGTGNPFKDWTLVFLPYCTQDIHLGGGKASVFPSGTVYRYGGINARAAIRYVRDIVWSLLDAETADGYRPDLLGVAFGGTSAGGFGAEYNYHYVLDDMRWVNSTAIPNSAQSVDNAQPTGVLQFAAPIALSDTDPIGWGARRMMPPYCFTDPCVLHANLQAASTPRLKATPYQQFLNLTNQVDDVQRATTYFTSIVDWTNALRVAYCGNQGLAGVRYFMPAVATSIHGILLATEYTSLTVGSVSVRDWLAAAVATPNAVTDLVEEGTLTTEMPGVLPFSCPVQ